MPIRQRRTEAQRRPLNNPFTGKPYAKPEPKRETVAAPSPLDVAIRQSDLAQARKERGKVSAGLLAREVERHAYSLDAHPVRRFRLRYPTGPLTVEDLSALSGVSTRTIERIENDPDHRPIDAVWIALAAALIDPSTGRATRRDQVDPNYGRGVL